MQPRPLQDLMISVGEKARVCPVPERYTWIAVWWHLYSRETKNPDECLRCAKSQMRLAKDMAARPGHYLSKPIDRTDWEWSDLAGA